MGNARAFTDSKIIVLAEKYVKMRKPYRNWCGKITDVAVSRVAKKMKWLANVKLNETRVQDVEGVEFARRCDEFRKTCAVRCVDVSDHSMELCVQCVGMKLKEMN